MERKTTVAINTQNGNETQAQKLSIFAEAQADGTIVYKIEAQGYEAVETIGRYGSLLGAVNSFSYLAYDFLKRQRFKLLDEDDD